MGIGRSVALRSGLHAWLITLAAASPLAAQTSNPPATQALPGGTPPPEDQSLGAPPLPAEVDEPSPWRLSTALGLPDWLEVGGTIRARFEHEDEQFRAGRDGHNQVFVLRSLFAMTIRDEHLSVSTEIQDSRAYGFPDDAILGASIVNAVEPLQWFVAGNFADVFDTDDAFSLLVGRHTMDVGSRRMVARNRYRNTINSFLGANAEWNSSEGTYVRAFYTHPTVRLPSALDQDAIQDNEIEFDEERSNNRFWGAFASQTGLFAETAGEAYYYGLERSDVLGLAVADREIHTIGTRWYRPRTRGALFWELEYAYQFGDSRALSSATQDLDHEAYFGHASIGYGFERPGSPQLELLFDYASGDRDPNDGENNRFDTLFGARRFEFGPTGILGAFARANLVTPGFRLVTKPADAWELMITHRFHYLASDRDAWTTSGLRDPTGGSGSHIGNLTELRVRYDPLPKSLRIELGAAFLNSGSFMNNVSDGENSLYTYVQTNFTF